MNSCSQCGSSVPTGQNICSMCYGDIDHGSDGHYRVWAEEQERRSDEEKSYYESEEE